MITTLISIEELNDIQARWMAVDYNEDTAKLHKLFEEMKQFPKRHLSISKDGKSAIVMIDGMPMFAEQRPLKDALKWLREATTQWQMNTTRFDVAWCGSIGKWVTISESVS